MLCVLLSLLLYFVDKEKDDYKISMTVKGAETENRLKTPAARKRGPVILYEGRRIAQSAGHY